MSMDKPGKQYPEDEARAEREKQKRREKKAKKKAKRQARKAAVKKAWDSSESLSSDSETSSSEESSDSSNNSSESTPRRRTGGRRVGAVSSGAPVFKIINGSNLMWKNGWIVVHLPAKPCERCGQRHSWHDRKEFNCSRIACEQAVPGEQGKGHNDRAVQEGSGEKQRDPMPISRVQGADECVQQIREALLDVVGAATTRAGERVHGGGLEEVAEKEQRRLCGGHQTIVGSSSQTTRAGGPGALEQALLRVVRTGHHEGPIKKALSQLWGRLKRSARALRAQCNYLGFWP